MISGRYGTCDWGGCHKPANQFREGLPVCDECKLKPEPRDLDEMLADHGDLEGVLDDLLKVSDDWKELRP